MRASLVLLGDSRDEHCDHLDVLLHQRGYHDIARMSLELLPGSEFTWTPGGMLSLAGIELVPSASAGLFRRPGFPALGEYEARYERFLTSEIADALFGALEVLDIRWVTSPAVLSRAELKLVQLAAAAALAIPYPASVVTNDPDAIGQLSPELLVVKPVRYGLVATEPQPMVTYTQAVTAADLTDLGGSPVIVQERLAASWHFRVTTVGSDVFVAGLRAGDDVDWRRDIDNHRRFQRDNLPPHSGLAENAARLATRLGLGFSAQDWIMTDAGQCVFLEANPNGQWLFVDHLFNGGLSQQIAAVLIGLRAQVA